MMTTLRRTKVREARKRECIFQQEEVLLTIKQKDAIAHPFMHGQFLHDAASRCIILGWTSKKFHLSRLGHLDFWEQNVETVNHAREFSAARPTLIISIFPWFTSKPTRINTVKHISEDRFRGAADRRVIEIYEKIKMRDF